MFSNINLLAEEKIHRDAIPRLRVFISSPGDVAEERAVALTVITALSRNHLLRGRIIVEAVIWDDPYAPTPMPASLTPQEAVSRGLPRPSECDIVIVILWSRMGTKLDPSVYLKPDGSPYLSGTEWEYEDAANAQTKPDILVYRRNERVSLDPDDPEFTARLEQYRILREYLGRFKNDDGSWNGSITDYEDVPAFKERLLNDLQALIGRHLNERLVASSVQEHMLSLRQNIEALTSEQYRVLRMLRNMQRVRITGCAGSGKTLVAAEKAIRLETAGLRTLLLCHSPLLAQHLLKLTHGTSVSVWAFCDWVRKLAEVPTTVDDRIWTNYDEPDTASLNDALDALTASGGGFDAVIVDEGQDFRAEWWIIVEAALNSSTTGILYIFHDDHQALLPNRSAYPVSQPVLDLSRNCRNAGRIFDLVRRFHLQAPEGEVGLQGKGMLAVVKGSVGQELLGLRQAIRYAHQAELLDGDAAILLGGGLRTSSFDALGCEIEAPTTEAWQGHVLRYFERTLSVYDKRGITPPLGGIEAVRIGLAELSDEPIPTAEDINLVREISARFGVSRDIRRTITDDPRFRNALRWRVDGNRLALHRRHPSALWAAEVILHFEREDWAVGLPIPRRFRLVPGGVEQDNYERALNVFDLQAFKGLEADTVMLLVGGYRPTRLEEIYVGVSRARLALIVVDCGAQLPLPRGADEVLSTALVETS